VSATGTAGTSATGATASGGTTPQGNVLGATASRHGNGKTAGPQGGVLGSLQAVGQGSLPFTGFPLWIAVIAALALIAFGLTLRRQARTIA